MEKLYILNEIFTNGLNYTVLSVISIISLICGVLVIISKNPIVSVLFLIGLFLGIAGYLMMLGINFIGLSYLLVYVGAVSILFLFILMLINVRISELVTDNNNGIPLAVIIGVNFSFILYKLLPLNIFYIVSALFFIEKKEKVGTPISYGSVETETNEIYNFISKSLFSSTINTYNQETKSIEVNSKISFVCSQVWDASIAEASHITSIGNIIYTVYPLWLIITSIILLLAMVGSIVITIKQ